ncbi:MAG TPA: hypothetical protein VFC78_13210 [Tepidisphaeraceae bacterium]|nr:hypothetical protein [Tepidisphaeraceae bacterium]
MAQTTTKKPDKIRARSQVAKKKLEARRIVGLRLASQALKRRVEPKKPSTKKIRKRKPVAPLPFYAEVHVKQRSGVPDEVVGLGGVIFGRAQLRNGQWSYSVSLQGLAESYALPHAALEPTGEVFQRSDFYKGEAVKILVDDGGAGTVERHSPLGGDEQANVEEETAEA